MEKEFWIDNVDEDLKNANELQGIVKRLGGIKSFNLTIHNTSNGTDFILKDKLSSIKLTVELLHSATSKEIQIFKKFLENV